ncbi:uncharacterized protein M421DRAFT_421591 [Didymella exigua CBS 183.55]|uniref:Uncharacterized protein n=1 Tax=Didymella exigua CBS 183.55 TaxID=1150837 RepID=A0A6A5RQI5_9PLEO|nr:uncharacterized protein M421DRAFT_421591 [Didymella exigua CBS 183.55]KAF1927747.1 hypothetical protein M421DRAFT_421591 [Didymella exigua CBS 183.55]
MLSKARERWSRTWQPRRTLKTRLPVRSALFKQRTGGLVVRWVTTSEYPLLYVFAFFDAHLTHLSWVRCFPATQPNVTTSL